MKKWKDFSDNEKMMIALLVLLLLAIVFSWERISSGLEKGLKPYQIEESTQQ